MSFIITGLYLSDYETAMNKEWITTNQITHILSIDGKPLPITAHEGLQYKFVHALDMNDNDLLQHFNECCVFINSSRQNDGNVLVHCTYGQSRSATIIIAYLMKLMSMSFDDAHTLVLKQKGDIRPNSGFKKQLKLFESSGYLTEETDEYKRYRLSSLANKIQRGNFDGDIFKDGTLLEDPAVKRSGNVTYLYKCRKCRRALLTGKSVLEHNDNKVLASEGTETICHQSLFTSPIQWMEEMILCADGKINCPKCSAKLGSFNWSGSQCCCGAWVTPSFHFQTSKVDYCMLPPK